MSCIFLHKSIVRTSLVTFVHIYKKTTYRQNPKTERKTNLMSRPHQSVFGPIVMGCQLWMCPLVKVFLLQEQNYPPCPLCYKNSTHHNPRPKCSCNMCHYWNHIALHSPRCYHHIWHQFYVKTCIRRQAKNQDQQLQMHLAKRLIQLNGMILLV